MNNSHFFYFLAGLHVKKRQFTCKFTCQRPVSARAEAENFYYTTVLKICQAKMQNFTKKNYFPKIANKVRQIDTI